MEEQIPQNKRFKVLSFISLILFAVIFLFSGYYFGRRGYTAEIKNFRPKIEVANKKDSYNDVDFANFWTVWDLINEKYITKQDGQKLLYGAIEGLTKATGDPYTSFLTPNQNESFSQGLAGEYEGVGIELGMKNSSLIVIAPLEGSPAEKAGILSADIISKIDGKETSGMSLTDAVSIIRGKEGTKITLNILHEGEKESKDYEIVRAKIMVPSVTWKDAGQGIVHLRLSRFGDTTNKEWRDAVDQILEKRPGLKGIVLDLRGNPGGYLSGSVFVVSEFVRTGTTVLLEEFADGSRKEVKTEFSGKLLNTPTILLVDGGSASSSEIVTAALRNLKKFTVVGVKSFGKGTIQDAEDFSDGSGIHITVAKWLDPAGNWYHEKGIEPDVLVELDKTQKEAGKDNQLEEAVKQFSN